MIPWKVKTVNLGKVTVDFKFNGTQDFDLGLYLTINRYRYTDGIFSALWIGLGFISLYIIFPKT